MAVVIYSTVGRIRRIITDGVLTDEQLLANHSTGLGEAAIKIDVSGFTSLGELQLEVSIQTGLVPVDDRYVALDADGVVTNVFIGDVACGDGIEGRRVTTHATAENGWRQNNAETSFERSLSAIDHDIAVWTAKRDRTYGPGFFVDKTVGEANAEIAQNTSEATQKLTEFNSEKSEREGPRP